MSSIARVLLALPPLTVCWAGLASAQVKLSPLAPAPPHATAVPTISPAQAQSVLDVLKDDGKRAQFIGTLEAMTKALPAATAAATPPQPGAAPAKLIPLAPDSVAAQLLAGASENLSSLSSDVVQTTRTILDFPLISRWVVHLATDPVARAKVIDTAWRLLAVFAAALAIERLAMWLVSRPKRKLEVMAPAFEPAPDATGGFRSRRHPSALALVRRLPFAFGRFALDLLPLLVFAGAAYALAGTGLVPEDTVRPVVLGFVNAYLICRAMTCVTRAMVDPTSARLRLLHLSDATAAHAVIWVRRLAVVAVFGYAGTEVALLFGLYRAAHDALLKLIMLVDHVMLIVIVLRNRAAVRGWIAARAESRGLFAVLRNRLAGVWHVIAIFYILALWLVWAFEVPDGFARLLRFFLVTAAVMICARLCGILGAGAVDRTLRVSPTAAARYPGLDSRAQLYQPIARAAVQALIAAMAAVTLIELWGFDALSWFQGGALGTRLIIVVGNIMLTVVLSLLVWEAANAAIQRHLAKLAKEAQVARSARLRTLLPMFRTTLLVSILVVAGLMVLSQIGVNIAPLLAGAGVLGLAIGFGSQKLVQDIITGLFLLLENTMQVGDVVTLGGLSGTVENLSIRTIRLRALDGAVHIIPFSAVTTVTNMTRDFAYAMMDISVGLNEEPDHIVPVLKEIATRMRDEPRWESAIRDELDVMGIEKFIDTAWVMRVRLKTLPSQRWAVGRELNRRVKMRFDELAIESPMTSFRALSAGLPAMPDALPKAAE